MRVSHVLQSAAVAGLMGLGILGGSTTPALADYVRTQCDRDGDYCWRVWCDWDGDDCHRVAGSGYRRYGYNRSYYGGYNGYGDYYHRYNYNNYYGNSYSGRRWVCDRDGDNCHWSYNSYSRDYDRY